jgi:hypothetical protein
MEPNCIMVKDYFAGFIWWRAAAASMLMENPDQSVQTGCLTVTQTGTGWWHWQEIMKWTLKGTHRIEIRMPRRRSYGLQLMLMNREFVIEKYHTLELHLQCIWVVCTLHPSISEARVVFGYNNEILS